MSRVGFGIVHDLRAELFQKLHDLPKSYFDANQSGQLINRITFTTTQVAGAASNAVKTLIREGVLLIGLFIYLLQNKSLSQDIIRYFLIIGVLGSYTTFSAFSFETIDLLTNNKLLLSFIYIILSLTLCLVAAYVGLNINKILNW